MILCQILTYLQTPLREASTNIKVSQELWCNPCPQSTICRCHFTALCTLSVTLAVPADTLIFNNYKETLTFIQTPQKKTRTLC